MDSYEKVDLLRMLNFCDDFGLKHVPIIEHDYKFSFEGYSNNDEIVNGLLSYVDNIKYRTYFEDASPSQIAEGIVIRKHDMTNSFKVVSNKFLLKGGE